MLRHFECFPLVWEILKRRNVPVGHLPLECVSRWVYCNVSVLEEWEGGRKKERKVIGRERQEGESGRKSKRGRKRERSRGERGVEPAKDKWYVRKQQREKTSLRASRRERVGSDQQHIRLHRGPWREASWLKMPSAKTDVWFLTQPNSFIWPAGQDSESSQRGPGDRGCLFTPKLYVMYRFRCPSSKKRCKLQGVIWWGALTFGNGSIKSGTNQASLSRKHCR